MTKGLRVLFWVQHLLGIGHIRRASLISQALSSAGFDVTVVLGGTDVEGIDYGDVTIERLPSATAADEQFKVLLDEKGHPIDDEWRERRRIRLLELAEFLQPDAILFDLFPFGRRQFRFELLPLLDFVKRLDKRPLIVSSARDILVKKSRPGRAQEQLETLRCWFDKVFVHGDPNIVRFDETFPFADEIRSLITYTGYVAPSVQNGQSSSLNAPNSDEVLVSAGGGVLGGPLFRLALQARPLCSLRSLPWRILTGPNLPNADKANLAKRLGSGLTVETFRPDLPAMMARARLSISQAGYNTTMDLLRARVPAIVVPISGGEETEQAFRAELLAQKGLLTRLDPEDASPEALATAIDERVNLPRPTYGIDLDGASRTAEILMNSIAARARM